MDNLRIVFRLPVLLTALLLIGGSTAVAPAPASAQTAGDAYRFATRTPALGTRALGMSGAGGVAGWADPSALYTNPAGLGFYDASEISGGLNVLLSRDKSTYQVLVDDPTFSETGDNSAVRLGSLNGVYNFDTTQGSLVFAAGFNRVAAFDRRLSYSGSNDQSSITDIFLPYEDEYAVDSQGVFFPEDVPSSLLPFVAYRGGAIEFIPNADGYPFDQAVLPFSNIEQRGSVDRGGSMNEFNFAGAFEAAPNFMVGVSANVSYGRYVFEHQLTEIDQGENTDYLVIRDGREYVGLDRLTFTERFASDFTGFNMRFGISAEATDAVRIGVSAETPTWYSITETFNEATIRTQFLQGGSLAYGDDPSEDAARGEFDYRLRTPWRLSTGLTYQSDPLLVSADVEFVDWTQMELDSDQVSFDAQNDVIEDRFSYAFNWRGGIEYRLDNGLRVRAGAAYRPDPRDGDFSFADGESEDQSRLFFSAGAGFQINEQVTLNVAWMQERTKDQFTPYPSLVPANATGENPPAISPPFIDEDIVRNNVQIGATIRF